jgi:3-phenylpropionate/cinnamic acid dioxygenase small subunit
LIDRISDLLVQSTANFLVIRIMQDGATLLFASGRYVDRIIVPDMKYEQRVVICDSRRFDTLLAIPL